MSRGMDSPRVGALSARDDRAFSWIAIGVAVAQMVGFAVLKLSYNPPLGDGLDGPYYFQIARHVAQGKGLVTTFSTFHMGLDPLPQPSTTYPLLPLLIGTLGRFIPLARAAAVVTEGAYVLSVGLCFGFVLSAARRTLQGRSRWLALGAASGASLLLGFDPVYHWATSRPYTEGVAYTLLIATLWGYGVVRTKRWRSSRRRLMTWGALGIAAGLCYLARFQFVVVPFCIVVIRLLTNERRRVREAIAVALGAAIPMTWMAARVLSRPNPNVLALYDYSAYRQLPGLPPFVFTVQFASKIDWVLDKIWALGIAFDPGDPDSYLAQFGFAAWFVPIGCLVLALQIMRAKSSMRGWLGPRYDALALSAMTGMLGVLPMHVTHGEYFRPWNFNWRSGIPLFFVIVPAGLWLLSKGRRWGAGVLGVMLLASVVLMARAALSIPDRVAPAWYLKGYAAVGAYLESVGGGRGTLGIEPQPLGVFTDAPLHWLACWSDPALAATLVASRPIDRIVLWPWELKCRSISAIRNRLVLERAFERDPPLLVFHLDGTSAGPGSESEGSSGETTVR